MSAPDNPQAFPTGDHTHGGHDGMTLRDWFAGQALANPEIGIGTWTPGVVAKSAYALADAMLAAREVKQ